MKISTILYDSDIRMFNIDSPINLIKVSNSRIGNNGFRFHSGSDLPDYKKTNISMTGCAYTAKGKFTLITNEIAGKAIKLKTTGCISLENDFEAGIIEGKGQLKIESDQIGLKQLIKNNIE